MGESKKGAEIKIRKKTLYKVLGVAVLLVFIGILYFNSGKIQQNNLIAKVNGEEIRQNQVEQMMEDLASRGQEITEQDAVNQVIDLALLKQESEKGSFSLTKEEAEQTLEVLLLQQGSSLDNLRQQIELQGGVYEEVLDDYKNNLEIQKYIENELKDVIVSDSEAREFYEANKEQIGNGEAVPPFEEIEMQIKTFIEQEKRGQAIQILIQELRSEAEIKYY
jgi:cell division protein FtsL